MNKPIYRKFIGTSNSGIFQNIDPNINILIIRGIGDDNQLRLCKTINILTEENNNITIIPN